MIWVTAVNCLSHNMLSIVKTTENSPDITHPLNKFSHNSEEQLLIKKWKRSSLDGADLTCGCHLFTSLMNCAREVLITAVNHRLFDLCSAQGNCIPKKDKMHFKRERRKTLDFTAHLLNAQPGVSHSTSTP